MLSRIARNSTSRVGSPIFEEALQTYVEPPSADSASWGGNYNEEEVLLYLRVGGTEFDRYNDYDTLEQVPDPRTRAESPSRFESVEDAPAASDTPASLSERMVRSLPRQSVIVSVSTARSLLPVCVSDCSDGNGCPSGWLGSGAHGVEYSVRRSEVLAYSDCIKLRFEFGSSMPDYPGVPRVVLDYLGFQASRTRGKGARRALSPPPCPHARSPSRRGLSAVRRLRLWFPPRL